jgi:hypothetical protein
MTVSLAHKVTFFGARHRQEAGILAASAATRHSRLSEWIDNYPFVFFHHATMCFMTRLK